MKVVKMKSILFGKKLRELRNKDGESQTELASYMNMSLKQIQRYEAGQVPRADKLKILSSLYKFDFFSILNEDIVTTESILEEEVAPYGNNKDNIIKSQGEYIRRLERMIDRLENEVISKDERIKELTLALEKTSGRRSA